MSIFFPVRQLDLIPSMVLRNPFEHPLFYSLASKEEDLCLSVSLRLRAKSPCPSALPYVPQ